VRRDLIASSRLMREDETTDYWRRFPYDDLVGRVATLHAQRRELTDALLPAEIKGARSAVGQLFLRGHGLEVGAGSRPFPLPDGAVCHYGDVRKGEALKDYFHGEESPAGGVIDAQTYAGIADAGHDFVIAAHVIEHLFDPVGAIRAAMRILKPGGVFVCVVPEMTLNWDRDRPPATVAHMLLDARDGGASTRLEAYREHVRYVHPALTGEHIPEADVDRHARHGMEVGIDIHVHAWRALDFWALLEALRVDIGFVVDAHVFVVNENIFVLRKI
jgi:SAM-dependent methyltransferase